METISTLIFVIKVKAYICKFWTQTMSNLILIERHNNLCYGTWLLSGLLHSFNNHKTQLWNIEISSSPIFIMRDSKYIKTYYLLICIIIVAVDSLSTKRRDAKKYHFYFKKNVLSMFFQPPNDWIKPKTITNEFR